MIRLTIFAAAVAIGLASSGAAQAQGETMKELLGSIGVIDKQGPAIEYRERAPLVLPPRSGSAAALPAPVERGRARNGNAQWPNDPDVAAARAANSDARTPTTETYLYRMNSPDNRLSPDEIRAGRIAARPAGSEPPANPNAFEDMSRPVSPNDLRQRTQEAEEAATGIEPQRRMLTQPPSGYRRTVSGKPVKPDFEAPRQGYDEGDPRSFHEEQRKRR